MKIEADSDIVRITELRELNENRAEEIVANIRTVLPPGCRVIEFDLAKFRSIDWSAVDRLLAIHKALHRADAFIWRLVNPPPDVRQLLELVRLHRLFEITPPRVPGMAVL